MNNLSIMIVEDTEINRAILTNIFENDYKVIQAENGKEALEILYSGCNVDLILLDIIMPVMDGIEFMEIVKKDDRYSKIPIIVNTSQSEKENELRAFELGADDFIPKPYNPKTLRRRVKNLIDKYVLEKRDMEIQLKKTEDELMALVNAMPGGIGLFEIKDSHTIKSVYYNDGLFELFGYEREEFDKKINDNFFSLISEDEVGELKEKFYKIAVTGLYKEEYKKTVKMKKKNGDTIWIGVSARRLKQELAYPTFHVVFVDLTDDKQSEFKIKETVKELQYRIDHDVLTGICNRETFYNKTRTLIDNNKDDRFVICMWNIDGFKVINELFGTHIGDRILIRLANYFKRNYKGNVVFARLESDYFVTCTTQKFFYENREEIESMIEKGIQGDLIDYPVLAHIGVYVVDEPELPVNIMCDRARLALQSVKLNVIERLGVYNSEMSSVLLDEQEIVNEMNIALEEKQFFVQLQPIVDSATKEVAGAEALVRWKHPTKGIIPPGVFIPLFERNGFITKLDLFVREEVCKILADNKKTGFPNIPISVNVSRINLYVSDFCNDLIELVKKYDIDPSLLKIEITESAYSDNPLQLINVTKQFQNNGFTILMDDFGSGYSSLNILKDVPVNVLKIDMQFLDNIEESKRANSILYSIIEMAKKLEMKTIAEGVENKHQFEMLRSMGCDNIQGYFFSKPLSVDEFREYVQRQNSKDNFSANQDNMPNIIAIGKDERINLDLKNTLVKKYNVIETESGKQAYDIIDNIYSKISLVIINIVGFEDEGFELLRKIKTHTVYFKIPCIILTDKEHQECVVRAIELGAIDVVTVPYVDEILLKSVENIINVSAKLVFDNESYAERENIMLKQSVRRMMNNQHLAICKIKAQRGKRKFHIQYANNKYYEIHGIAKKAANVEYDYSEFLKSTISNRGEKLIDVLRKTVNNNDSYFQRVFLYTKKNGEVSKSLTSCFVNYEDNDVYYEIYESEIDSENEIGKLATINDVVNEVLLTSKSNVWKYEIKTDEIKYCSRKFYEEGRIYTIRNGADYMARDPWYSAEDKERILDMHERLKAGEKYVSETFYCEKEDRRWWNKITYYSFFMNGTEPLFAIGVSRDVTEEMMSKEINWQGSKYKEIMVRDAYLFAEINLEDNQFYNFYCEDKLCKINKSNLHNISYDGFINNFIEKRVLHDEQSYLRRMFNRLQLIKWCREGESEIKFDFHIYNQELNEYEWYSSTIYFMNRADNNHSYAIWLVKNVNSEKVKMARITTMAEHDSLTGLYNRIAFQKIVESAYSENESSKYLSAFMMIDIDNFKTINDSFGHEFGDNVLKTIASQIRSTFRQEDSIGRLGGDEFAVFISRISDKALVEKKAEEICKKIQITFNNCSEIISISCSIGIAFAPEAGIDFNSLYANADEAQYMAKRSGKNKYVVYKP